MDKGYYVIIESSEIFTSGIIEIVKSGLSQNARFFSIHYRKDLNMPHPIECIIVGNGLGVEMSLLDLLVYIKSLKLAIPVICIPEMITSKMAKQLFTEKLLDGILHRDCTRKELIEGIDAVMNGKIHIGRQINLHQTDEQSVKANKKNDPFYLIQTLTHQERQIMEYVIEGKSSNDISQILFRSIHTIKTHRRNLLNKLGVTNTIELITYLDSIEFGKN